MHLIVNQVFTGIVSGAVLVLLALGLNLIFGFMEIINFSHGAFFMLGAYVGFYLLTAFGSFWWGLALVPLLLLLLGAAVERTLIKPLYRRSAVDPLLLTFGLTYIVTQLVEMIAGKQGETVNAPSQLNFQLPLGFTSYPAYLTFVAVLAGLIVLGLWLLLERTSLGLIIRAGIRDSTMIQILGIDFDRFRVLVFALGIALAGVAGVLNSPVTGVYPEMGNDILITAFVVVVVGGMGSFWGAVLSGLVIGVLVSLTTLFASVYASIVPFVLMILVMTFRPRGLLGTT